MNVIFYVSDTHCCGHIRGEELARVINTNETSDAMMIKSDVMKSDFAWADVMVFQRQMTEAVYVKMLHAKTCGIKTIYDIDDNLLEIPEELGEVHDALSTPEIQKNIIRFLSGVDVITTSSMTLAEAMRRYCNTPICVLKNGVCVADWAKAERADDGKVTIGWMGSKTHIADASLVSSVLRSVMQETDAHLKLIGWVGNLAFDWLGEFPDRVHEEGWVEVNALPRIMVDIDIGIAPLQDSPFNRCKSSVKWMQYSAMGIPAIMSNIPPYTDDVEHMANGILAGGVDEWHSALKRLVLDGGLRDTLGKNALMDVLRKHSTEQRASEFMSVCKDLK